ncbi:hypothetical protein ATI61_10990 [Archangium gephyra]|uniref:Uncharacterized protein n=1 Tax=Archangium gephyra TaxID=48 RepID=A0ABX9JV84_9BACT|nr:response regulator transcription factor [Archangium gephyra]REG27753.1 hypothetical protein ATI61_10990 [Archangium gephyra]
MPRTTDLPARILALIEQCTEGLVSYEVAQRLGVSERTARTHLLDLFGKAQLRREYVYYDRQAAYRYFRDAPDPRGGGRSRQGTVTIELNEPSPRQRAQQNRAREGDDHLQQLNPGDLARLQALSVDTQEWTDAPPEMRQLVLNVLAGVARLESSVREVLKPAKGEFGGALRRRAARHLLQPFLAWSRAQDGRHKRYEQWVQKSTEYERAKGAQGALVAVLDAARAEARVQGGKPYKDRAWRAALRDKVNAVLETAGLNRLKGERLIQKLNRSTARELTLEILGNRTEVESETLRRGMRFE